MNQISDAFLMPDVQASIDRRRIAIGRVGVRGVRYPLRWRSPGRDAQATVGQWDLDVLLPQTQKGTHMSRFVELLDALDGPLDEAGFRALLSRMLDRLDATAGQIDVSFPYFVRKRAPVSGVESLLDYAARVTGRIERSTGSAAADVVRLWLEVSVPVTSLCPCSKEISRYGAHNQRSHVTIRAQTEGDLALDELVRIAEDEASCELWGLLKRPDEKFVTERAYENPKFVEDLVRDVAVRLDAEPRVRAYRIDAENFESIHNHSAYASIERTRDGA